MFTFTVQESVTIDRPIEEVFDFISDSQNDLKWCPAVNEIEPLSTNGHGPTRYRMHHSPGGMDFEATVEVVTRERPHLFKWVMTDKGHTLHGMYELEEVNGRTHLTQTSEVTFEGWLRIPGLFLKRVIAKDVRKELNKQFANLKQILEEESERVPA